MVRATTGAYFDRYRAEIREDADRLRGFNRMVSHERKGPLGAIQGAATLLGADCPRRRSAPFSSATCPAW